MEQETEIDLVEIFYLLKAKLVPIILSAVICALGAAIFSFFIVDPTYSSTSKIFILSKSTSITSLADIQMSESLTSDYMELIQSRPVVEKVISNLNLHMTYEQMLGKMEVTNPPNTRILSITISDGDPRVAKVITDEFSEVSKKQISEIMKTDEPTIFQKGHVDGKPVSPNKARNTLIGGLVGLLLSAFIFIGIYLLDDTIKSQEDVEKYLGLNTLALVPLEEGTKKKKRNIFGKGK